MSIELSRALASFLEMSKLVVDFVQFMIIIIEALFN